MRVVSKFGGTSVGTLERIKAVADLVEGRFRAGEQVIVTLSAMGSETDRLLEMATDLQKHPDPMATDMLLATGENTSVSLLAIELRARNLNALPLQGWQIGLTTDNNYRRARITGITTERLEQMLADNQIPIITGFQGICPEGRITTLGRGGSDTSAVALAVALKADECVIYTDVNGVYTADPRIVEKARQLEEITYEEMLELSGLGAQILERRAVEFAIKHEVKLRVCSSFTPDNLGTLVTAETQEKSMETLVISAVTAERNEAKITVRGVPDSPGLIGQILRPIGAAGISVDMIVQNIGRNNTTDITFTVARADLDQTCELLKQNQSKWGAEEIELDSNVVKISVIGVGMRGHSGVASKMFTVLGDAGINIQIIATSEIKISVTIEEKYLELAMRELHTAFDLDESEDE